VPSFENISTCKVFKINIGRAEILRKISDSIEQNYTKSLKML
jgi:hypothetical protein